MSASSSPGWTWSFLLIDRWLFIYPPASSAVLFLHRRRGLDLSGLDRPAPSSFFPYYRDEDDLRRERRIERLDDRQLGCFLDSVPVTHEP